MEKNSRDDGAGLLLFVLILLGLALTASVLTVSMRLTLDDQATTATQAKLKKLAEAISNTNFSSGARNQRHFEQDVGSLPSSLNDLLSKPAAIGTCFLSTSTQSLSGWCGPYWPTGFSGEDVFADGWNNTIVLSTSPRQVRSKGSNGVDDGGAGDDIVQPY